MVVSKRAFSNCTFSKWFTANPWLTKSKRFFSSGEAGTYTTREMEFSSQMLYQLSYKGLGLKVTILLVYIMISIFFTTMYLIFLETKPSWKGQ